MGRMRMRWGGLCKPRTDIDGLDVHIRWGQNHKTLRHHGVLYASLQSYKNRNDNIQCSSSNLSLSLSHTHTHTYTHRPHIKYPHRARALTLLNTPFPK